MEISICSFSFHRMLSDGKQDVFQYIRDSKALGATQLQPWNAHMAQPGEASGLEDVLPAAWLKSMPRWANPPRDEGYLAAIRQAADDADMPFEAIAVDRAHIYEDDPEMRRGNRLYAYRWLDIAEKLGARHVRIDAGGPADMPDDVFRIICEGYDDLVARGRDKGVGILTENHWGPTPFPDNVVRLMENVEGLGLLFDTNNWAPGHQEEGWDKCARYAAATHVKTFAFDEDGNEPSVDIPRAIGLLVESGYRGVWGVESCPKDGDEMTGARKTIELINRSLGAL